MPNIKFWMSKYQAQPEYQVSDVKMLFCFSFFDIRAETEYQVLTVKFSAILTFDIRPQPECQKT